jgi:hypothetical protein
MKAVREKSSSILYYLSDHEDIEVREDGFYKNNCFYSPAFTSPDFDVVEFDPGSALVFVDTHKYQDGVLSVADEARFAQVKRERGAAHLQLRNSLLQGSDVAVLRAYESGVPVSAEWVAYRQALRDIPQQPGFPDNIQWPTKPE